MGCLCCNWIAPASRCSALTLIGNLLIVGSIANIIVVDAAHRRGVTIDWKRHARTGIPVTLLTLAISWMYLWFRVLH